MKLFAKYLRQRWRGIAAGVIFCIIFIATFILYRLPVKAVIYPAILCVLTGTVFAVVDFIRIRRKYEILERIKSLTDTITENFPQADGIEDEEYQNIIRLLNQEFTYYKAETAKKYSDMTDYYTVWAHQIKTPIASMRLNLQNEDTSFSRKLSADLFRIEQYVDMVLTFLRLSSGSTDYVIKEYELDSVIKQSVKKFAGEFINRKISLVYEPVDVKVITDEKWLSFVIEQVLSNALKYTPSGSITIKCDNDGRLFIKDTGIGIAAEDLPRIFENGYTGYNGRTDKKASGIGLYLCKRICNNLGHGITAESAVDAGTTIIIDLSRKKTEIE